MVRLPKGALANRVAVNKPRWCADLQSLCFVHHQCCRRLGVGYPGRAVLQPRAVPSSWALPWHSCRDVLPHGLVCSAVCWDCTSPAFQCCTKCIRDDIFLISGHLFMNCIIIFSQETVFSGFSHCTVSQKFLSSKISFYHCPTYS